MTVIGRRDYRLGAQESLRANSTGRSASRLLVAGETVDGAYTFRHYFCEDQIHPHTHSKDDENVYVLSGRPTVRVGDRFYEAGPGAFVFMPKGELHAISSDAPWEGLSVSSPGHIFETMMDDMAVLYQGGAVPAPEALGEVLLRAGIRVHEGKWYGDLAVVQ